MDSHTLEYKFAVIKKLLREIAVEWQSCDDIEKWRQDHVEAYGSNLSFDDLIREIVSIRFK